MKFRLQLTKFQMLVLFLLSLLTLSLKIPGFEDDLKETSSNGFSYRSKFIFKKNVN